MLTLWAHDFHLAYYIVINRAVQPAEATGLNVSLRSLTVLLQLFLLRCNSLDMLTIITSLIVMAGAYIIIKE